MYYSEMYILSIAPRCIFYGVVLKCNTFIELPFVAPSEPTNISLTTNSSDCIILKWEEPEFSNGKINSYQVGEFYP